MYCVFQKIKIINFRQIALPRFLTTMENDFSHHLNQLRSSVPALTSSMHKGDAGRIGVVGGSLEYTGAPYFAAITALTVGADLVHVFCAKSAGPVIKSYSPELIVHPILDDACCVEIIKQWLPHLHVVVIGPGLGRDQTTISAICRLITTCMKLKKPLVIDADGLFLLTQQFHLITNYDGLILTPNAAEFRRVFGENHSEKMRDMNADITVLEKGQTDRVWDAKTGEVVVECPAGGSNRRCGGQGDLLCGAVAVFYCWGLMAKLPPSEAARAACCAGSLLTKECNRKAFARRGRAMVTSDMVEEIAGVFRDDFEIKL